MSELRTITKACDIVKETAIIRGGIAEIATIARRKVNSNAIRIDQLIIDTEQPEDVCCEMCQLLPEFRDYVTTGLHDLGCARFVEMDIRLEDGAEPDHNEPYQATKSEPSGYCDIIG